MASVQLTEEGDVGRCIWVMFLYRVQEDSLSHDASPRDILIWQHSMRVHGFKITVPESFLAVYPQRLTLGV